jgi:uncharacterized cupin superfamily protein
MATKPREFPIVDPNDLQSRTGSAYPEAFQGVVEGREVRGLGDALGLSNFGVNLVTLEPGAASSQRHWHSREDEFVYVLDGDLTLVTEAGETVLGPGMAAGFPAGKPDGHCLVNRTDRPALPRGRRPISKRRVPLSRYRPAHEARPLGPLHPQGRDRVLIPSGRVAEAR